MGVTSLWQIVQPCARPIKIETLNRKRLAVDASIWIYQFLKAVRDKEGNALRNSHVVGFFRRICKLLFFGIKPVFVFDGGAPALKRQTISARKARREGRRDDAVRTAGKLLAVQMQRRAEEEEARRRAERDREPQQEETVPDDKLIYVDEMGMSQQERQQSRRFRKKDQYHLPELAVSMSEMGGANDPRIMSLEELQTYARQFDTGEDINVYDFSKIDYDSPFFMSLPASDRYNILNAARLRSRLRMGHSKEQLDNMFPDRMAFSKFQIERVRERNELTQRLMHLNGFEGTDFGANGAGRIAGEKGREYILVKNDGVEGGWALGVISDEGKEEKPIDLDEPVAYTKKATDADWEDEEDFEDVPIEGLNRLPKPKSRHEQLSDELMRQRRGVYQSRKSTVRKRARREVPAQDPDSLFVQSSDEDDAAPQGIGVDEELFEVSEQVDSDEEHLKRAIQLSLEKEGTEDTTSGREAEANIEPTDSHTEDDHRLDEFQQSTAAELHALPKGSGRAIAHIVNKRAFDVAPESRETTSFGVPTERRDSSDEDDGVDLQAALRKSRKAKQRVSPPKSAPPHQRPTDTAAHVAKQAGFDGPLPFEKLDLGSSLLGRRKMQERSEETAGGFENPELAAKERKQAGPLPPWFSGDLDEGLKAQKALEAEDRERAQEFSRRFQFQEKVGSGLRRAETNEVIDLENDDPGAGPMKHGLVDLDADEAPRDHEVGQSVPVDDKVRMGDIADNMRAEPPWSSREEVDPDGARSQVPDAAGAPQEQASEDEELEWSGSDEESRKQHNTEPLSTLPSAPSETKPRRSSSLSDDFEDVDMSAAPHTQGPTETDTAENAVAAANAELDDDMLAPTSPIPASGLAAQTNVPEEYDEFDDFSDPEEQEMLRNLATEAEEHARFASQLNNKSQAQNIRDYETELKQLRNQQKKDRRDADEVTHVMISECQQLLSLFGLPYITAPMEAEAQCAELVSLGLVDGIVTDDSDCFLFGGTRIYKNMFNQAKFVECYLTSDLEKEFDLTRDKLIAVAHLLGSDYTEGLPGVGPVTALEIISEFPTLEDFRDWWSAVQMQVIPKSDDASNAFRKKFRRNAAKLFLPPTFPDQRVALAYMQPDVDHDPEAFQWGVPDLAALRSFLMATIGWSQERTDEVLVPVIRDMNRRIDEGTQANITAFFDGGVGMGAARGARGEAFAPRKRVEGSKRMGSALNRLAERAKLQRSESTADKPEDRAEAQVSEQGGTTSREEGTTTETSSRKRKGARRAVASIEEEGSEEDGSEFGEQPVKSRKRPRGAARRKA